MSDYNDVLYDPRTHTHTSCIDEVSSVDIVVLIIGSRFGGRIVPQALLRVDLDSLKDLSKSNVALRTKESLSVTQLEVFKAVEASIPVFAFVDARVMTDHATYERNKGKGIAELIDYASIERPETAAFIFEFINFLRLRLVNNALTTFSRLQDIEEALRRQWSGLLQRLLLEQRTNQVESRRIDALTSQFEDLKTAILAAVGGSTGDKEIARAVMRFRKLIDFVRSFPHPDFAFMKEQAMSWGDFLELIDVAEVVRNPLEKSSNTHFYRRPDYLFVKRDRTFYEVDKVFDPGAMIPEWVAFMGMTPEARSVVFDALSENRSLVSIRRYINYIPVPLETYRLEQQPEQVVVDTLSDEIPF